MNAIDSAATHSDQDALDAIRRGDTERYRELIERHERQVYAVAWSRLGDAELARDATQDAFIKAYRSLGGLREGSRFGAWVAAIVRSISINLGIRHRKELKRRERWQLEHQHPETPTSDGVDPMSGASLRTALESLPPIHRECLVLFYLEGKSVAESSAALGVSEGTFKTRLHRARTALRDRMEERLEDGLEHLRPPSNLVHSIMLALPATPGLGLAGGGLSAFVAKLLPGGFLTLAIPLVGVASGLMTGWWLHRKEKENFRDPDDFRVRSHLGQAKRIAVFSGLVMVFSQFTGRAFPFPAQIQWLAPLMAVMLGITARMLRINRSPFALANAAGMAVMTALFAAVGFFDAPIGMIVFGAMVSVLPAVFFRKGLPHTHDYNLFLRHAHGLLRPNATTPAARERSMEQLFAFARVLGPRWIVVGYRQGPGFLRLILPGVRFGPVDWLASLGRGRSSITLWTDGRVAARLSVRDARALVADGLPVSRDYRDEESAVEAAMRTALDSFDRNDPAGIEAVLGQVPDATLFKVAPERAGGIRSARGILLVSLMVLTGISFWGLHQSARLPNQLPPHLQNAIPARLTAAEFQNQTRSGIVLFRHGTNQLDLLSSAVWRNVVLPPRSWWPEDALRNVTSNPVPAAPALPGTDPIFVTTHHQLLVRLLLGGSHRVGRLLDAGLITTQYLKALGYDPETIRRGMDALSPDDSLLKQFQLSARPARNEAFTVLDADLLIEKLSVLDHFGGLDLVESGSTVALLRESQVLPGSLPPGRRPLLDRAGWNGHFLLTGYNPLEETWQALWILDRFRALDSIDREACIGGILRFHLGEGRFGVRGPTGWTNGIFFTTPAKDTFYAYESLRRLNALDRVTDLTHWKFRFTPSPLPIDPQSGVPHNQAEIWEAGVLQDRFNNLLKELKTGQPARSLTDPSLSTPPVR